MKQGDCLFVAIENLKKHPDWKLCFGLVNKNPITNTGFKFVVLDGTLFPKEQTLHAWNENEISVMDTSQGKRIWALKDIYHERFGIKKYIIQDVTTVSLIMNKFIKLKKPVNVNLWAEETERMRRGK